MATYREACGEIADWLREGSAGAVDLGWEDIWKISPTGELWPIGALYDSKAARVPVPSVLSDDYFGPALARLVEVRGARAAVVNTLPQERDEGGGEPEPVRELTGIPGLGVPPPGPPTVATGKCPWGHDTRPGADPVRCDLEGCNCSCGYCGGASAAAAA